MVNIIKTFRPAYRRERKPSRVVCASCLLFIGLFYLTTVTNTATAATYYLDAVGGIDSNPGTSEQPWQTLSKAKSTVSSGDTVIMRDGAYGAYYEAYVNRNDWVTYKADVGHNPEFTNININWNGPDSNTYLKFDGLTIRASSGEYPISMRHTKYTQFLNLDVIGQGAKHHGRAFNARYSSDITIDNCTFSGGDKTGRYDGFGEGLYTRNSNNITITNNEIMQFRGMGVFIQSTNNIVRNNHIHKFGGDAGIFIVGGEGGLIIENNEIHDIDVHYPELQETPTETTWSEDGTTMTNPDANWEVNEPFGWAGNIEIYINSGNNVKIGDNEVRIVEVISSTKIRFDKSIKLDSNGSAPSNVDYILRDKVHADLIQAGGVNIHNVVIRKNILYDIRGGWAFMHLQPLDSSTPSQIGGYNFTVENNLAWNSYEDGQKEYGHPLNANFIDGLVFRNNIVIGRVQVKESNNVTFLSNIVGYIQIGGTVGLIDNDYNILNRGTFNASSGVGANTTFLNPGHNWDKWNDTAFTSIFADYYNGDFQHAFAESLGVGHSDPANFPSTDILGNVRDSSPDAGCYEYTSSDPNNPTPELQAIGDKFVDENVALAFTVNATDPNGEPITYSAQGLPSGATLDPLTGDFTWTPSYQQARSYQIRFIASDGNSWDSETINITVNNVNRPPVLGSITDQSVNENDILSLSVNASDPDGQALTYSVSGLPAGAVFVSQTLTWTPSYDQAGAYPVTFTADDGQDQDSEAITITVINVNRTPVLAAINNQSVWADDPLTFTVDATDPDGDAVTYSVGTLPSGATFATQTFDWTPSQGQMGSYDVTFIASDGQLQDSEIVTITVDVDSLAPAVTNSLPTAGSIQAPLNNLINLNITDAGKGVDADSVTIKVNNNTVYTGDTNHYTSPDGECRRLGNKADYRFVYQSNEEFDYDQTVSITVNATDLAGNVMSENSYSFVTEMRSFGQNMMVNSGSVNLNSGRPVTVRDSSGNIWAAWHAGPIDNRDIYIGKLAAGEENFGGTVQLTDNTTDQCNPAVALDSSDKLYVVWQDNREGDWDIYVSTSVDGISWTTETRVNDPNDGDQVNPAIVIDGQSPNQAYVVWQDDRAGSQDICVATSSDGFGTKTVSQITSDISDQVEPAIAADSDNTIYIVWTDGRNGSNDIYGATSNNGLWNNVPVVTEDDGQSSPAIATEAVGSILHLVWVDDRLGDDDIYYDKTVAGLSPLTGSSIIDDTTGADQISPVIITTGYTGNDLKVFVCWRDERNADADLYFVEIGSDNETNVFVGDDGTSTDQSEPAIGIDGDDYPYLVWTNERTDIYYAGSTFVEPVALASTNVSVSSTATVGTVWNAVNSLDDVSAEVPQGAYLCDVKITISKIKNPPKSNLELDLFSGTYEFGPSGMEFIEPVTITIPYEVNGSENVLYTAYWYNPLTNTLSQQGITDVETIVISSTLHAVRFKTTHFSAFILGGGVAAALGSGGGGCSVSAGSEGNIVEFILPYIGLAVVMVILKMRDARYRKARNT